MIYLNDIEKLTADDIVCVRKYKKDDVLTIRVGLKDGTEIKTFENCQNFEHLLHIANEFIELNRI